MKFIRTLTLILFGFGLFVQVGANAAALPQIEAAEMSDCAEMADNDTSTDPAGPCSSMTLDCVIAMNCLPPLALSNATEMEGAPLRLVPSYLVSAAPWFQTDSPRPESPPPKPLLTV